MKTFRARVLWSLLVLVVAIQVITVAALVLQTNRRAEQQAGEDLLVGARVLDALLQSRSEQLREAVRVLVADYGFKEAATLGHGETIASALENSALRIDAQLAILLDPQGRVMASTVPQLAKNTLPELERLASDALDAQVVRYLTLDGTAYMLVATSVRAPTPVATAVLGFAVDAGLAERLSQLLHYRISFVVMTADEIKLVASPAIALPNGNSPDSLLMQLRGAGAFDNMRAHTPVWEKPLVLHGERDAYVSWLAPVAGADANLRVLLQKQLDDALAPYKSMQAAILAVSLLALLVAIPFALRLARQISRPLEKLASAARRIEAGNYTERVALDAPREFVAVATTLDSMQHNIAEREQRIRYQATHDELTSLPNRMLATEFLQSAIDHAVPNAARIAILVLELKEFESVRSSFGFAVGDAVLCEAAKRLASYTADDDMLAKVAVTQFLWIACGLDSDAAALKAQQWLQAIRGGFVHEGIPISLDARVGIAIYPDHGTHAIELQRRADTALFDAAERDSACAVYAPERDEKRKRQLALLGDLRGAINADELVLYYQPKVDMRSHAVKSLEALVRWFHPQHGRIPPDEFVPLAERTGNIAQLTAWVLKAAIQHMRLWKEQGFEPDVSVNIAASDLSSSWLADYVLGLLASNDIDAERLVLEVTESGVMNETKAAVAMMDRLRHYGVRFSVDDFGTGYSSLAQFKQLPVDEIKIDKSFVLKLEAKSDDAVIVRSTIELGHNLGVLVVAEGVETPESWRMLLEWGCDLAQGYFISPPVPMIEVLARVRAINEKLVPADTATQQIQALKLSKAG
jgi:diguanylate cyclase (GGDEF)-like protein